MEEIPAADISGEDVNNWKQTHKQSELWMSREDIDDLLRTGKVLFVTHLTKDGWPMVTPMFYCMLGNEIYTSTIKGRSKEIAYRRDNRMSASVCRQDLTFVREQGLTIKGRAEIDEDRELTARVCRGYVDKYWNEFPKDIQEKYFQLLYTKDRVAVRIVPDKIISWDSTKLAKKRSSE